MKKIFKIGCALLIFLFMLSIALGFYFAFREYRIRKYNSSPDRYGISSIKGNSLSEYGFKNGQEIKIYYNQKCQPGDICAFKCLIEKCNHNGVVNYIKQLKYIENGCYWFQGNTLPWEDENFVYDSHDSRDYGLLCPGDFRMDGVVK
jgi:hypothetical protein